MRCDETIAIEIECSSESFESQMDQSKSDSDDVKSGKEAAADYDE
jgi:hypothetical protein